MRPNHVIETRYAASGGDILAYDCEGNLSCVSNAVSGMVSLYYWYDQHGRLIAKSESGLLTLYIWDGMDIIATAHADGTLREYYTRGIGIAGDVGSLVAETRFSGGTATTTYLHSNWRGDVVMATDAAGNVVGEYAYTTFGEQLSATGTYTPRFTTFSSKERDASGLVYHGFRYYCPVLCRWISEDPIGENGGINLYQFCGNDPVNGSDPDGEQAIEAFDYWFDVAVSGQDAGGILGNLQTAGASIMMSFVDFWGARSIEGAAGLSGYYSGSDECHGKAWGYDLYAAGMIAINALPGPKGLKGPKKYFGDQTADELIEALTRKYGSPRSVRPGAQTFYNLRTGRSFNVHTDPAHGAPHVDIRRRGGYPDRSYPLGGP
jgi:RHS repeat-associated protein